METRKRKLLTETVIRESLQAVAAVLVFVSALFIDSLPIVAALLMLVAWIAGYAGGRGYEKRTHTMLGGSSEFSKNSR